LSDIDQINRISPKKGRQQHVTLALNWKIEKDYKLSDLLTPGDSEPPKKNQVQQWEKNKCYGMRWEKPDGKQDT